MPPAALDPTHFGTPAEFRAWLARHHGSAAELWVGFYKKDSGRPSITWPESVDEALSFGWIDGVRRRLDDERYMIRFTPRRRGSNWSEVNVKRAEELIRQRRMERAGLDAFEARDPNRTASYSFEQRSAAQLPEDLDLVFRANEAAWDFFHAQPPGYVRMMLWWIVSAKRDDTRRRRLQELIEVSAAGRRVEVMKPKGRTRE